MFIYGQKPSWLRLTYIVTWELNFYSFVRFQPISNDDLFLLIRTCQPDWPVYRDLVMTSPYDDVIIHKLQYATT